MRDAKQFFIISLIIHLLVFIILACIVLPPVDRFREFLDSLSADFVELEPVVREHEPVRDDVKKAETQEAAKPIPKPPEPAGFSVYVEKPPAATARIAYTSRTETIKPVPVERGTVLNQPLALKPVPSFVNNSDTAILPDLQQQGESTTGGTGNKVFTGLQPQPAGGNAGIKGQGTDFIYPFMSPVTQSSSEFSDILPELADGIMERASRKKMDVVFVIDTTGSMRDNVRGVRDYIHRFIEPLEESGFDAALGLVEFTDLEIKKAKVVGLTGKQKTFRKWLDKTVFFGGTDLPESGYEALLTALQEVDFREDAQRFFIFISDAPQHDLDYDGRSGFSLDRILTILSNEGVQVDVVGANYLPVKQLAWGTGGQWKHIPGGDPVTDIPYPSPSMIRSQLEDVIQPVVVEDTVTIEFRNRVPDWVDLSYKILDPLGFKCLGTLTYRKQISSKTENRLEFATKMDLTKFGDQPGIYTLIYRIRDSMGNRDVLRRTLVLRAADSQKTS